MKNRSLSKLDILLVLLRCDLQWIDGLVSSPDGNDTHRISEQKLDLEKLDQLLQGSQRKLNQSKKILSKIRKNYFKEMKTTPPSD